MQRSQIAWIVALLLVIGVYICCFSHWGEKREIQVVASVRPVRQPRRRGAAPPTNGPAFQVVFTLDAYYKLTGIEVAPLDRNHPDAAQPPLWKLVSRSNSVPVKLFTYGQLINGMQPYLPSAQPDPLVPGAIYRIEVSAGNLKGASLPFTIPDLP
jgi:hypothetical protein